MILCHGKKQEKTAQETDHKTDQKQIIFPVIFRSKKRYFQIKNMCRMIKIFTIRKTRFFVCINTYNYAIMVSFHDGKYKPDPVSVICRSDM